MSAPAHLASSPSRPPMVGRPRALLPQLSSLELTLRALRPVLSDPEVTELCINAPGEAFIETSKGGERRGLPFVVFDWCGRLVKLVANSPGQRIDAVSPLLSASL